MSLARLYAETVQAVLMTFSVSSIGEVGESMTIPVIPSAFPGESVTLTFERDPVSKKKTVTFSAPVGLLSPALVRHAGPFPTESGEPRDPPQGLVSMLASFAEEGPERLSARFRDLVKELLRAGLGTDELHQHVDLALAESVMET